MQKNPLTNEEMQVVELNAEYLGITHTMLMHDAGREVARVVIKNEKIVGKRIAVLCGLGGNGGDGMVAARYLQEAAANVEVYLLGSPNDISNSDTNFNWGILQNLHEIKSQALRTESDVKSCKTILESDILVDALMGFGLRTKLREPLLTAVKQINKSSSIKYSIDVPTGVDSDTGKVYGNAVKADHTIALHAPKIGISKASEYVGKLHTVSIGIPAEASFICGPGDVSIFTQSRSPYSHKGDFGRVLVIGGSDIFSGAPALTGVAALRTGCDLVTILAPEGVVGAIRSYSPNLMVQSLGTETLDSKSVKTILGVSSSQDVVALGPGLGQGDETKNAVQSIVRNLISGGKPIVIDADGLKALALSGLQLNPQETILTPHWGELEILLQKDLGNPHELDMRIRSAKEAASKFKAVVLLKGPIDVIANPDGHHKVNRTGVPAMTVGGTGDVLTGIAAALLSRGKGSYKAARAAAFVSGLSGELAFTRLGDHITATDCIEEIPYAMTQAH